MAWSTLHSSRRHLPPPREVQHNHHRLHTFSRMSLSSWRERAGLRANHAPPLLARTKPWTGSSFVYRRHHVPQPPRPPRTFDEWGGISPRNAASFPRGMFCISAGGGERVRKGLASEKARTAPLDWARPDRPRLAWSGSLADIIGDERRAAWRFETRAHGRGLTVSGCHGHLSWTRSKTTSRDG